ncbi:MAG: cation diffusion facilitator family transporter [Myxococcales bacterium]|nr:cation diffusion facilitator family transporter [Myxococcales bacterium]
MVDHHAAAAPLAAGRDYVGYPADVGERSRIPSRITLASVLLSVVLTVPLVAVYLTYGSQLALAQAADSFTDAFTALALLYSLHVGSQPADAEHPRGHHRAEPIAALVAAVLAGVLAVEVFHRALDALSTETPAVMGWPLAAAFAVKVVAKTLLSSVSGRYYRKLGSPALQALQVDARNDVLVGLLALVGFFAARYGSSGWDAWLALPIACWIAAAGLGLARENIRFLMGEAPPEARQQELMQIAGETRGVDSVHALTARYDGTGLDVTLHVVVDENLVLRDAHDIAESVELRLMQEPDVLHAMVHVDVEADHA